MKMVDCVEPSEGAERLIDVDRTLNFLAHTNHGYFHALRAGTPRTCTALIAKRTRDCALLHRHAPCPTIPLLSGCPLLISYTSVPRSSPRYALHRVQDSVRHSQRYDHPCRFQFYWQPPGFCEHRRQPVRMGCEQHVVVLPLLYRPPHLIHCLGRPRKDSVRFEGWKHSLPGSELRGGETYTRFDCMVMILTNSSVAKSRYNGDVGSLVSCGGSGSYEESPRFRCPQRIIYLAMEL